MNDMPESCDLVGGHQHNLSHRSIAHVCTMRPKLAMPRIEDVPDRRKRRCYTKKRDGSCRPQATLMGVKTTCITCRDKALFFRWAAIVQPKHCIVTVHAGVSFSHSISHLLPRPESRLIPPAFATLRICTPSPCTFSGRQPAG